MPAVFQDLFCIGDILSRHTRKAQLLRLEVHGKKKAQVIQESRNQCRQDDDRVPDVQELRHDEARSSHDRGTELASCRGCGLHCGGILVAVARLLHDRYGYGSRGGDVGNRRAVDHSQKGTCYDRDLCRSTGRPSHQRQGQVVDELGETAVLQKCSEDHEEEDVCGRDSGTCSQDSLGAPELGDEDPLESEAVVTQVSGEELSKKVICKEDQRQDGEVSGCPSSCLEDDQDSQSGDAHLDCVYPSSGARDLRVLQNQISEGRQCQSDQDVVRDTGAGRQALAASFGRIQQEGEQKEEDAVKGPQAYGGDDAERGEPELQQHPDHHQYCNCRIRFSGVCPHLLNPVIQFIAFNPP